MGRALGMAGQGGTGRHRAAQGGQGGPVGVGRVAGKSKGVSPSDQPEAGCEVRTIYCSNLFLILSDLRLFADIMLGRSCYTYTRAFFSSSFSFGLVALK